MPIASLRWNAGVNNYMTYIAGDVPVGAYDPNRLSNIGIGHSVVDAGGGYTFLNPQTGHEFSGVLGFTYNFTKQSTQYQNGVDMHFDWGASQFPDQASPGRAGRLCLQRDRVRQRLRRPRGLLPVASGRRRPAARIHCSAQHHDAGLSQFQRLQGIRQPGSARRLEYMGDVRDLAGGTDAECRAETNDHEIARRR